MLPIFQAVGLKQFALRQFFQGDLPQTIFYQTTLKLFHAYKIQNSQKNHMSTIIAIFLLATLLVPPANAAVTWLSIPDVTSGQIAAYPGPQLVNSMSPAVSFTQPIALSSPTAPFNVAFGINLFQVPHGQDFSIITNKTTTGTAFTMRVYLLDETVCQQLRFNYIAMITNSQIYRLISDSFNPTVISNNYGFRSETDTISVGTSDPFFGSNLRSVLVLEGIRVVTFGAFSFVDSIVTLGNGVINTTFITFEDITITYIAYSILFYNDAAASATSQLVFQLGSVELSYSTAAASNFFTNIMTWYKAAAGRMFFGFSSFNFSVTDVKKYGFDSSNIANLYSTYTFSSSIYSIRLSYYFFAQRSCASGLYFYYSYANPSLDDCVASCSVYTDRPTNDITYSQCLPCHYSCLTCSANTASACLSCNTNNYRSLAGTACSCVANYINVGSAVCSLCSSQMQGCLTCSTSTTCTACIPGFSGPPCTCSTTSVISGYCNSVFGCTNISAINGTQTCINCNTTALLELTSTFGCACIYGTNTMADKSCQPNCGDGYVLKVEGCDDGNTVNGDGCSSCTVDQDWVCVGKLAQGSTCKINSTVKLSYMGAIRETSSNRGIFYFSLKPVFSKSAAINYSSLLSTTLSYARIEVEFSQDQQLLIAKVDYLDEIENTQQKFQLLLNNSNYFWHPTNHVTPTLAGINCELTYESGFTLRKVLYYLLLILLLTSILVFVVSCLFFEKWIGLELILTYQSFYFLLALLKQLPFELSPFAEVLKYSQGFDGVLGSQFYRLYGLPNYLLALSVEKEFISNFNTMYFIIVASVVVLMILGLRRRHLRLKLQEVVSSKINEKLERAQRMFSFVFSRIFMMTVFYSMLKITFSFCIQLNNDQSAQYYFPDQLNACAGILALIIVFSMVSYVLYWYLLLPDNFTEEQEFMFIRFQKMKFNYPIIYLGYQSLFILTLVILVAQPYVVYILLALQVCYLVFIIVLQPYNPIQRFNRFMHNLTVVFNQLSTIFCLAIIIRWNSIIGTDYHKQSSTQLQGYSIFLVFVLMASLALTIFRLAVFNREVDVQCFKKEQKQAMEQIDYASMKRMETERKEEFYKAEQNVEMAILSNLKGQHNLQQEKKRQTNQHLNETQIDAYLISNPTHWNKQTLLPNNVAKAQHKNVKKTTKAKKAELKKSSIEIFLQCKRKRQEGQL